jgi:prepilin-type N-terminal cleavage/methylation domain-containing protein
VRQASVRRSVRDQGGYSLVEVMASILILSVAIIPMVAMFDVGLDSAVSGSNYDRGRTLAKKQMEVVQSLSFSNVKNNVPNAPCTFDSSGLCEATNLEVPTSDDPNGLFDDFRYSISKQYVDLNDAQTEFEEVSEDEGYIKVTVQVGWGSEGFNDTEYAISSVKAR